MSVPLLEISPQQNDVGAKDHLGNFVSPDGRAVEEIPGDDLIHDHAYENENKKTDCFADQLIHPVDRFKKHLHEKPPLQSESAKGSSFIGIRSLDITKLSQVILKHADGFGRIGVFGR